MKRYIAIVLAVLMAVSMAGCGQARDLFPESTGDGDVSQTAPVDEEGMKVGYLLPSGTDETDTSSHIESIRQMQYETGLKDDQVLIRTDVAKDDCAAAIDELVKEGCNIIFACDGRYENIVLDGDDVYFDYGTFRVPLPDESYGVRRLFSYISLIIDALSNGKCIVSDELDSHLHQEVIVQIVREFSSKNGTGAQLVMATHDTELLAMKEVKKDEVWFTRLSGPERSTELYALSEFDHLDESRDYRKEYLGGFYGALPSTGRIFGEDE